ncbi:hypothetical protein CGMCC3_g10632 [Colletotrichum fructicola]|nr:uncharacterized protein CGMCC3_g10632 [Colletotrichum fructicola]KAE9573248.1 hypothetical protein CGMCC3_g10632 [Colletotrichum fructicola]
MRLHRGEVSAATLIQHHSTAGLQTIPIIRPFPQDTQHTKSDMDRREGHKHTHIPFHVAIDEFKNESRFEEARSPQRLDSTESSSTIAHGRVALDSRPQTPGYHSCESDEDIVLIDRSETISGPPSVATDNTVVNRMPSTASQPSMVLGTELTSGNMVLHNLIQPLGTMTTYEWVHGRRCPGDLDVKDISSKESIKVRCHSRVSQSTAAIEDEYGMVNHPSESFVACAGDWADVAALPASFDKTLRI